MLLNEISYQRHAEWKETGSPNTVKFNVDDEEWFATLSGGKVNEQFITGTLACGPHNMDVTGEPLERGLSASQRMRQAMVGFHTVGKWIVSLAKKYPKASISIKIFPASSSRSKIYQQLIDQLQREIPDAEVDHSGNAFPEVDGNEIDAYLITRVAKMKQASFPKGAWGQT